MTGPSPLSVRYRLTLLHHIVQLNEAGKLALPGMDQGRPSDAMFRAFAKVPMEARPPNVDQESLPFDTGELIRLNEEEGLQPLG